MTSDKRIIANLKALIKRQSYVLINRDRLLRNYKLRLKKIRNEIDYLLEHPYSIDTSNKTRKYQRDSRKLKK